MLDWTRGDERDCVKRGGTLKNDGKGYEALTEVVFRRLLAEKLCADVTRDVKIQGRSTTHQIDVAFRFCAAGVDYQTIVQCKDWGTPVKQEQVLAFHAVLQDIPGQPRGIIVAKSGFQEGARGVAEHHGIKLYELRPPKDEDWDGLLRELHVTLRVASPSYRHLDLILDDEWLASEILRAGMSPSDEIVNVQLRNLRFETEDGKSVPLQTLLSPIVQRGDCGWTAFSHRFPAPVFVEVPGVRVPRRRVLGVRGEVSISSHATEVLLRADHMVAYCFKDVLDGTFEFLDASGARFAGPS